MQYWRKSADEGSSHFNRVGERWRQIAEDSPISLAKRVQSMLRCRPTDHFCHSSEHTRPSPLPDNTMSQPQYAPAATAGGQQNGPVSFPPPT
jgi:hypothetical protein